VGKEYYDDLADIKSASVKNGAKTHEIKMGLAFNKPVEEALEELRTDTVIDKDSLSL
jgi:hypothetical protein